MAAARNIPLTFGSDAHAPEEVGMAFGPTAQWVKKLGYTHYCRFENRRPIPTPL
jgi:histidinol phosphatase-like PHP family hydrolase